MAEQVVAPPPARLSESLVPVADRVPSDLISSAAGKRIRRVAAELPAALTDWIYLECRLSGTGGRVDLIMRIDRAARDMILGAVPLPSASGWRAARVSEEVRRVCRAWADAGATLGRKIHQLWLEFDVPVRDGGSRDDLGPGIFIGFDGSAEPRSAWRVVCALAEIVGQAYVRSAAEPLRRCFAALPSHGSIPYLGLFPSREPKALRLCIARLNADELLRYLQAIRWPGRSEQLRRTLGEIRKVTAESAGGPQLLHLDVGGSLLPAAGLEYALARAPQLRGRLEEQPLLELLVRERLCTRRKHEALRAWPGVSVERLPHQMWPTVAVRRVNHVKLVIPEFGAPFAKAYLSINSEPLPRNRAVAAPAA